MKGHRLPGVYWTVEGGQKSQKTGVGEETAAVNDCYLGSEQWVEMDDLVESLV